jgi:hypothetical protein
MSRHEMHELSNVVARPSMIHSEEFEAFEQHSSRYKQLHCQISMQIFLNS